MADNVAVTAGSGTTIAADEVVDGTLGTVKVQYVKLMDGTLDGSTKATVGAGGLKVDPTSSVAMNTGTRSATTQRVTIATDDSVPVTIASVPSHAVTNAGTFATQITTINSVAPAFGAGASGATVQRVVVASDQLASSITTQGAFAAGAQQVSLPSDHPTIPVTPAGNVAHDAADSGNPVKQGFKATSSLSAQTPVSATADRTDGFAGMDGVQLVRTHTNLEDIVSGILANTDGASTAVIAAAGAGIKIYITSVIIANTSATAVTVDLRDGAAGSVKATFPVPANTSGVVCNLPVPLGFTANTAVCMDGSAAASTVTCTLIGFKSKV